VEKVETNTQLDIETDTDCVDPIALLQLEDVKIALKFK